jgi:hypothetical protein
MTITVDQFMTDEYDPELLTYEDRLTLEVEAALHAAAVGQWVFTDRGHYHYRTGEELRRPVKEWHPPQLRAIEIWLAHRAPDRWPLLARKMKS